MIYHEPKFLRFVKKVVKHICIINRESMTVRSLAGSSIVDPQSR